MRPKNYMEASALFILLCVCIATPAVLHSQDRVFSGGAAKSTVVDGHSQQSPAWQTLNSGNSSSASSNSNSGVNDYVNRQGAGTVVPAAYRPPVSTNSSDSPKQKSMPLEPPSELKSGERQGTGGGSTVQMFVSIGSSLLIVIGLFLGAAWFYKKTLNAPLGGGIPNQVVKVLGRTPIAARQHLVLVRFGSKLVLVSMIQGEARALSEITDPLEVDQLAGFCESQSAGSASQSFRNILNQGAMK